MDYKKYTSNAEKYSKFRSEYPKEFIDYLYESVGLHKNAIIADIGSGTGKLSNQLLLKGSNVYSVEPNDDMRRFAEKDLSKLPNFISIKGTAENTTLQNSSVDFITVGTAFHWFDMNEFKKECRRILKPKGKVILVWISRPVNRNNNFEINFKGVSGGKEETPELIAPFLRTIISSIKFFKKHLHILKIPLLVEHYLHLIN